MHFRPVGFLPLVVGLLVASCGGGDGPTGDSTPPTIVSFSPAQGATGVPRTTTVSVTFSEVVDPATVIDAVSVSVSGEGLVPGELSIHDRVVTFVPGAPLEYGTTHQTRVSTALEDLAGNALAAQAEWSFSTVENPAPTVVSTIPVDGATDVDPNTQIVVTFSEPVTVPPNSGLHLFSDGDVVAITSEVDGSIVTFTPVSPLAFGATYTAVLVNDIRDLDGNVRAPFEWTFTMRAADSAPESVSPLITLGVTVEGEEIDAPNDVDEFHLTGEAGDEWIVFVQSGPGEFSSVQLTLRDSLSGSVAGEATTPMRFAELEEWSTGRFTLPVSGPYVLSVTGEATAEYRFRVDAIDRAPETAPATFAVGDTVSDAIGGVGDVDEFTFEGTAGQEVSLLLQLVSGMARGLTLDLLRDGDVVQHLETGTPVASLDDFGVPRFALPATGTYTVRVLGPDHGPPAETTGPYRFELYPIDRRPENGAVVALDGPAVSEAIGRPGDVDEFSLAGTVGQLVVLHLEAADPERRDLVAHLTSEDGTRRATVFTGLHVSEGGFRYSRRIELPTSGTYRIAVQGFPDWATSRGAYTLEAYTVSPAPEHVSATILVGETISAEPIDRPGDLDVFTFQGDAGRLVNLFLGWEEANGELFANLGHNIFTRVGTPALDGQSTGRLELADSTYTLTIDPHWAAQTHMLHSAGAYAFRIFQIDRRPEGRIETYVVGDTVSGEPLYPSGDIDEYVFELTETTTLEIFWDASFSSPPDAVWGRLFDDVTGAGAWSNNSTQNGEPVRQITLSAGRYRLRVLNENVEVYSSVKKLPTLPYRFAFVPASP